MRHLPTRPTTTTTTTTTGRGGGSSSSATTITKKQLASAPGVAWSYGGNGNCEGTGGYADVADGYPGLYGDGTGGSSTPQLTHSLTQDSTPRFKPAQLTRLGSSVSCPAPPAHHQRLIVLCTASIICTYIITAFIEAAAFTRRWYRSLHPSLVSKPSPVTGIEALTRRWYRSLNSSDPRTFAIPAHRTTPMHD